MRTTDLTSWPGPAGGIQVETFQAQPVDGIEGLTFVPYFPHQVHAAVAQYYGPKVSQLGVLPNPGSDWRAILHAGMQDCISELTRSGTQTKALQTMVRIDSELALKKAVPLFVTGSFVRWHTDPNWRYELTNGENGHVIEHILPVAAGVNTPGPIVNPGALFWALARGMVWPVSGVIGYDDRRLNRLINANWAHPLLRYTDPATTRMGDPPIELYDVTTGLPVDPHGFHWTTWLDMMRAHPLTQAGATFYDTDCFDTFAPAWTRLFGVAPPQNGLAFVPPAGPVAVPVASPNCYTTAQLDHIHRALSVVLSGGVPLTVRGGPAIRIPVRRDRVQIVQRSPDHQEHFAINIGPQRRIFEIYHNPGRVPRHISTTDYVIGGAVRAADIINDGAAQWNPTWQPLRLTPQPHLPNAVTYRVGGRGYIPITAAQALRQAEILVAAMIRRWA